MTYLIQILLPLFDNDGQAFEAREYVALRSELAERSGGGAPGALFTRLYRGLRT